MVTWEYLNKKKKQTKVLLCWSQILIMTITLLSCLLVNTFRTEIIEMAVHSCCIDVKYSVAHKCKVFNHYGDSGILEKI